MIFVKIRVYQSENDYYEEMELLAKLKYIGETFYGGYDGLSNGKIYDCVGYSLNDKMLSIVDDSNENYMYPADNPRPLDGSSNGGKWEVVEIYENELKKILSTK